MFAAGIAATRCVHTRGIYSRPVSARSNEARLAIASARPRRALHSAPSPSIVSVKASATHAGDAREPPRSRVADIVRGDDAPPSRPVTSAVTRALGAFALCFGALAVPASVAPPAHAAEATATSPRFNPNLITLPEPIKSRLNAVTSSDGPIAGFIEAVKELAVDPWDVEDVWAIVLLRFLISKGRRAVFDRVAAWKAAKPPRRDDETASEETALSNDAFEDSFLGWLGAPLKALQYTWIVLYAHDVLSPIFVPDAVNGMFGDAFDLGSYAALAGAVAVMVAARFVPPFLRGKFTEGALSEPSLQTVITRLVMLALGSVAALKAAILYGFSIEAILGVGGVGGLAVGLAARDLLTNLMGGTMLAILAPFSLGEQIYVVRNGNFRGSDDPSVAEYTVKQIGWYQTTLEAKDTRPVLVPNGYFMGSNVINISRATARVIICEFRVMYSDRGAIPALCEKLEAYLRNDASVDAKNYPVRVNLTAIRADHLVVGVETHVHKLPLTEHLALRARLLMGMLDVFEANTAGTAFPTEVKLEHTIFQYPVPHAGPKAFLDRAPRELDALYTP